MAKPKPVKDSGPYLRHKATGKRVYFMQWLNHHKLEFKIYREGSTYTGYARLFEASHDNKQFSTDLIEECYPYPKSFPEATISTGKVARSA